MLFRSIAFIILHLLFIGGALTIASVGSEGQRTLAAMEHRHQRTVRTHTALDVANLRDVL